MALCCADDLVGCEIRNGILFAIEGAQLHKGVLLHVQYDTLLKTC